MEIIEIILGLALIILFFVVSGLILDKVSKKVQEKIYQLMGPEKAAAARQKKKKKQEMIRERKKEKRRHEPRGDSAVFVHRLSGVGDDVAEAANDPEASPFATFVGVLAMLAFWGVVILFIAFLSVLFGW